MEKYFVILNGCGGLPNFISDDDGFPIPFEEEKQAESAAKENDYGKYRGYEILEWPYFEETEIKKRDSTLMKNFWNF